MTNQTCPSSHPWPARAPGPLVLLSHTCAAVAGSAVAPRLPVDMPQVPLRESGHHAASCWGSQTAPWSLGSCCLSALPTTKTIPSQQVAGSSVTERIWVYLQRLEAGHHAGDQGTNRIHFLFSDASESAGTDGDRANALGQSGSVECGHERSCGSLAEVQRILPEGSEGGSLEEATFVQVLGVENQETETD